MTKVPARARGARGSTATRAPRRQAAGKAAGAGRPYHHGALREALIDAAAQLAAEAGPGAVSLREVARRAGVSPAAPYHYFADKSALFAAVAEQGFTLFDASQAAAMERAGGDAAEQLAALGVAYVRFALDRPHYFKVMFRKHLIEFGKYPSLAHVSSRAFERLVDVVRAARMAQGHEDADPVAAATLVWAVPHGLALLYLDGPISARTSPRALELLVRAATRPLAAAALHELDQPEGHWGI